MVNEIRTSRLSLCPVAIQDLDSLHRLWTDPEVRKYIWDGVPISREEAADLIAQSIDYFAQSGLGLWAVRLLSRGRTVLHEIEAAPVQNAIIGFCGYWYFRDPPQLELIYGLLPAHWGTGLATEAAQAMIQYGFDRLPFDRILGSTDAANETSARVMERAGMKRTRRDTIAGLDTVFYEISRSEYERAINKENGT